MTTEKDFSFRLMMFCLLSTESEKWALMFKNQVSHEFKFALNNFLASANHLQRITSRYVDQEIIEDIAESFSVILEQLHKSPAETRDTLLSLLTSYTTNNLTIIQDADNIDTPQPAASGQS